MRIKAEGTDTTVRERMLKSAITLFNQKGYASTTVREIVEASGVSKPVLYYYFDSKEGIYLGLFSEPSKKLEALLDGSCLDRGTAQQRLILLMGRIFDLFLENFEIVHLIYAIQYGPPQGAPFFDFDAYHRKLEDTIDRLVEEGMEAGEFAPGSRQDIVLVILGALDMAMEIEFTRPAMAIGRDGLIRLMHVIFQGILKDREGAEL